MHPPDCPRWEYSNHPQRPVLTDRIAQLLVELNNSLIESTDQIAADTRPIHARLFHDLTPGGCEYFAGHYRGEEFRCLKYLDVGIQSDPRVGYPCQLVLQSMDRLSARIVDGIEQLDRLFCNTAVDPIVKLQKLLQLVSAVFVDFLTVHPYANGNGHAGRLLVWAILMRYGFRPTTFTVEPRPDPPYVSVIVQCRNGNPFPLIEYFACQLVRPAVN